MIKRVLLLMVSRHGQALWLFLGLCYLFFKLGPSPHRLLPSPHSVQLATIQGDRLAGIENPTTIGVLDTETMTSIAKLVHPGGNNLSPVSFSPDGKYLITSNHPIVKGEEKSQVHVWDVRQGKEVLVVRGGSSSACAFSPDSTRIALPDEFRNQTSQSFGVWDIATGERLLTVKGDNFQWMITSIAWSPDGKSLASASASDNTVRLYESECGKEVWQVTCPGVRLVWFSTQGTSLLGLSSDMKLHCWNREGKLRNSQQFKNVSKDQFRLGDYHDVFCDHQPNEWLLDLSQRYNKWIPRWAYSWIASRYMYRFELVHWDEEQGMFTKVFTMPGSNLPLAIHNDRILGNNFFLPLDSSIAWWPVQPPVWPIVWKAGLGALGYWLVLSGLVWWRRRSKCKVVVT